MTSMDYQDIVTMYTSGQTPRSRPLSRHSNATGTSSRRGSSRISKLESPNTSPHYVQRRRTTASHMTRAQARTAYDSALHARDQRLKRYYGSRHSMPVMRPMSWHPSSEQLHSQQTPTGTIDNAVDPAITGLENLAVTNAHATSVQASIQAAFAMAYGFPINTPSGDSQQTSAPRYGVQYQNQYPIKNDSQYAFPYNSFNNTAAAVYPGQAHNQQMYSYTDYAMAEVTPPPTNEASMHDEVREVPNATFEPNEMSYPAVTRIPSNPPLRRKKSKELVGIGLYNDKEPGFMSSLTENINRRSLGKELKLEESWVPPSQDAEEDEDDDDCSSEEGEEVEEVSPDSAHAEPQPAFYPAFGDMSSQSFFFNDDDQLNVGDNYTTVLALRHNLQEEQAKVQSAAQVGTHLAFL